MAKQLYLPE